MLFASHIIEIVIELHFICEKRRMNDTLFSYVIPFYGFVGREFFYLKLQCYYHLLGLPWNSIYPYLWCKSALYRVIRINLTLARFLTEKRKRKGKETGFLGLEILSLCDQFLEKVK